MASNSMPPEDVGRIMAELGELKRGQDRVCRTVEKQGERIDRLTEKVDKLDDRVWEERDSRTEVDLKQSDKLHETALEAREAKVRAAAFSVGGGAVGAGLLEIGGKIVKAILGH